MTSSGCRRPFPARAAAALVVIGIGLPATAASGATAWQVRLAPAATAAAQASPLPAAPASVTASCSALIGTTVIVSWSASTSSYATGYRVYQSSVSSSGPWTAAATVGAATLAWTSGGLGNGKYWFTAAALAGSAWEGPKAAAAGARTISSYFFCT